MSPFRPFIFAAYLAVLFQSGGNTQFRQNIPLKYEPDPHYDNKPPDAHLDPPITLFLLLMQVERIEPEFKCSSIKISY